MARRYDGIPIGLLTDVARAGYQRRVVDSDTWGDESTTAFEIWAIPNDEVESNRQYAKILGGFKLEEDAKRCCELINKGMVDEAAKLSRDRPHDLMCHL